MKFNYTKVSRYQGKDGIETVETEAGLDLDYVFHWELVKNGEDEVLVLSLTGEMVETIKQVKVYNAKGIVKEVRPTKMSVNPVVEVVKQEDINNFMTYWNQQ